MINPLAIIFCCKNYNQRLHTHNNCEKISLVSIDELPDEVLVHIFGYLEPREILRMSVVCSSWHKVIKSSPSLMQNYVVSFFRNEFNENHAFVNHVLEKDFVYPNLKLSHTVMENEMIRFWHKLGPNLHNLILNDRLEAFDNYNYSMLFLKAFNIERLDLNMYLDDEKTVADFKLNFHEFDGLKYQNLKELVLFGTVTLNWIKFFHRTAPNLTSLELCQTNYHPETIEALRILLDERCKQMKQLILHLVITQVPDYGYELVMKLLVDSRLQLESFKFYDGYYSAADRVDRSSLIAFLRSQTKLQDVELIVYSLEEFQTISYSASLRKLSIVLNFSDSIMLQLFNSLVNLQELCVKVGQSGVLYFSEMAVNKNMRKLQLELNGGQKVTKRITNIIATCYPNLTNLRMNNCNSNCLPVVFEKLQQIVEFCVSVDVIDSENDLDDIINLRNLKVLLLKNLNFILNDKILIESFNFPRLERLEFIDSGEHVTDIGIIGLALKSPLIRCLCLKDFNKITDKSIEFLSYNVTQLEELNIEGCRSLTPQCVNYISKRCLNIRYVARDF